MAGIRRRIERSVQALEQQVIERLVQAGEAFVQNARQQNKGDLGSSIGYAVFRHGEKVAGSRFEPAPAANGETSGAAKGRALIEQMAENHPSGCVLIVVAGASYAAVLESKGRDVLTGSSQQAKASLTKAIKEIEKQLSKRS